MLRGKRNVGLHHKYKNEPCAPWHAPDVFKVDIGTLMPKVGDSKILKGASGLSSMTGYELDFTAGVDMEWAVELKRLSDAVEIAGSISGEVELECVRCLHKFDFPLDIAIREIAIFVGSGYEEIEGPAGEYLVVDGVLDLEQVFRDAICLSLPHRRVCADTCRGICPLCGADLNVETCSCASRQIDIRLKPLLKLKDKLNSESIDE